MIQVPLSEIKQNLASFLQRVENGETLVITKKGTPLAEVKPVRPRSRQPRPYGLCAGEFTVPEDFDAPLPEEIIREFEE